MASRTPPLLEPYLGLPPEASLIVLTGVLGASTNWLVQRYLCRFLATTAADRNAQRTAVGEEGDSSNPDDGDSASVVLVSFLRDYAFWKEGAGRIGVDLDASSKKGKFVFVDGLSKLFSGGPSAHGVSSPADASGKVLSNSTLHELRKQLAEAVTQLRQQSQSSKIVLILDSPDLLLAATGKTMTGAALQDLLLDIREVSARRLMACRTSINRTILIGSSFVNCDSGSGRTFAVGPDNHPGEGTCCVCHILRPCG